MIWDSERPSTFEGPDEGQPGGGGGEGAPPVVLTTVYDPVEAEIILAKLRSAGIPSFARHEALSVVAGLTVDGCGQHDIMVRPDDLAEARAALASEGDCG
jgi:hypothetical protein